MLQLKRNFAPYAKQLGGGYGFKGSKVMWLDHVTPQGTPVIHPQHLKPTSARGEQRFEPQSPHEAMVHRKSGRLLPGVAMALPCPRLLVFWEPLPADVLHDGVAGDLGGLENILHEQTRLHRVQLHRQEIRRPQFTTHQVCFYLHIHTHKRAFL